MCACACSIAYGVLDVGFPEETFGLVCDSTSSEPATVAAWSDPWPVVADAADPACVLYKAGPRDTVSGMADHFQTDILDFVEINTRRGVIPTLPLGDPPRQEPQLQGPWEGAVFKVCNIPQGTFDRVATGGAVQLRLLLCVRPCRRGSDATLPAAPAAPRACVCRSDMRH